MKIVEIAPAATPNEAAAIEAALKCSNPSFARALQSARSWSGRIYSTDEGAVATTWREAARREAVDAGV